MQIQKIDNYNRNVNFKAWIRRVDKINNCGQKVLSHCNTTCFFRPDFGWEKATKFIIEKYKDLPKVNVYNYGCSNGSEIYSFLMYLESNYGENILNKFSPIIAKDFDNFAIEVAKKGILSANIEELNNINKYTHNKFLNYFDIDKEFSFKNDVVIKPKKNLSDKVFFETADILKDYKNIKPNNSIVFARNFWIYLSDEDRKELAKNLYNHLGENSLLILGSHDNHQNYQNTFRSPLNMLKIAGFKQLDPLKLDTYIFTK